MTQAKKPMPKPKKIQRGGKRPGAGAPKGNNNAIKEPAEKTEKKLVSARLLLAVYETLEARALASGRTVSAEVEALITSQLTHPE